MADENSFGNEKRREGRQKKTGTRHLAKECRAADLASGKYHFRI
jgi:hypothetical protein